MATNFQGWLNSWNGWGATDPNAASGTASFTVSATGTLTGAGSTNDMQGSASMSITASGYLSVGNDGWIGSGYGYGAGGGFIAPRYQDKRRSRKRRDNDMLFLSH